MYVAPDQSRTPTRRPHWSSRYPWLFLSVWCGLTISLIVLMPLRPIDMLGQWSAKIHTFSLWLSRRSYNTGSNLGLVVGCVQALLLPWWSGWAWRKVLWIGTTAVIPAVTYSPVIAIAGQNFYVACGGTRRSLWSVLPIIGISSVIMLGMYTIILTGLRTTEIRRLLNINTIVWLIIWGIVFITRHQNDMQVNFNCGALK